MAPRIASAIAAPSLDAVPTAPGSVLNDLDFARGRMQFEELAVDGEPREPLRFDMIERIGERHLAEAMVMPVGLSVRRRMRELWRVIDGESLGPSSGERLTVIEQAGEGDVLRDRPVIEEDREAAARRQRT